MSPGECPSVSSWDPNRHTGPEPGMLTVNPMPTVAEKEPGMNLP